MKEKVLTVCVAAFNVEKYIKNTLESCCIDSIIDQIEVIVVNDGSTDNTVDIARKFENKYPDTFRIIDKENGGYGSVVMEGIKEARGIFFKLLDGDDWFDPDGITKLVDKLSVTRADAVISGFCKATDKELEICNNELIKYDGMEVDAESFDEVVGMWQLTARTSIFRQSGINLPHYCLYTDTLYVLFALPYLTKIEVMASPVYCHYVGRSEQSISRENRIKHADEALKVFDAMFLNYMDIKKSGKPSLMVQDRMDKSYRNIIRTLLLFKCDRRVREKLIEYEGKVKSDAKEIFDIRKAKTVEKIMFFMLRKSNYYLYYLISFVGIPNWG